MAAIPVENIQPRMKRILAACLVSLLFVSGAWAGRPILMSESEACVATDLVVIAEVGPGKEMPKSDDPFGAIEYWHGEFTERAEAKVEKTLLGEPPKELVIYGGQRPARTLYVLKEGRYLVLLKKLDGEGYRATDGLHSFVPLKDGKAGWPLDPWNEDRKWMSPEEVVEMIKGHKKRAAEMRKAKEGEDVENEGADPGAGESGK